MNFKVIALVILFVVYLWNLFLNLLKARSAKNPIPANVADVYDGETYQKWKAYNGEKSRLSIVESTVSFLVDICLLAFNLYAAFARLFSDNTVQQLFAVLLLSALTDVFLLPMRYYDTMRIEEKYGFNRTSKKTFWLDQVKQFVIGLGFMTFIGWLLMAAHQWLGDWLILAFAGGMTAVLPFFSFLYPFFSKIFNSQTQVRKASSKAFPSQGKVSGAETRWKA